VRPIKDGTDGRTPDPLYYAYGLLLDTASQRNNLATSINKGNSTLISVHNNNISVALCKRAYKLKQQKPMNRWTVHSNWM